MAISSDMLIERKKMSRQLSLWRLIAIGSVVLFSILLIEHDRTRGSAGSLPGGDYIARVTIDGIITDDRKMDQLLERLRDDDHAKAVILYLNTPGGTAVGGQNLYKLVKEISARKPIVSTMGSLCASAGYMTAMAADRVFVREGTITASIGVIFQSFDATGLADKIGIAPVIVKSGPLKGSPNPFEKTSPEARAELQALIDDFFQTFKQMVADSRHMTMTQVNQVADGRVVGGTKAVQLKLADQLGGEEEALDWLHKSKHIAENLSVKDVEPKKEKKGVVERFTESAGWVIPQAMSSLKLDGLLLIWQPALGNR